MRYFKKIIFTLLLLANAAFIMAQKPHPDKNIRHLIADFDTLALHYPSEKMYVHFDKPYYMAGDTIWFKVYLFNGANLHRSSLSGVMYVEMANEDNQVVKRMALPVVGGLSWGDIPLDTTVKQGAYSFRAFTSWMLNFSGDHIFTKQIKIGNNLNNPWIAQMALDQKGGKDKVHLRLFNIKRQPLDLQPVKISLVHDKKNLHTNNVTTNGNGELDFNFTSPKRKSDNLSLWIGEKSKTKPKIKLPLMFHRPQEIDLQFMPEGGNLIPGWPERMGFKAIGADGRGVNVSGAITDSKGDTVAHFHSMHKGMGSCLLLPEEGETYSAHITRPTGNSMIYPLPKVKRSGTSLQVHNVYDADSFLIQITATPDITGSDQTFMLIGRADGRLLYANLLKISDQGIALKISKSLFPHGITRFNLLDMKYHPLNERLVFIDRPNALQLKIKTNKKQYLPHDSIPIEIEAVNPEGKPVRGSFSIAATDDAQVRSEANNIIDYIYFSSYLKGNIEDPDYYLSRDSFPAKAMDNLLLTQGWTGYNWSRILHPTKPPQYQPQPEFAVKGKVLSPLNKPVNGARVLLVSGIPPFMKDTVTGKDGAFKFTNFPPMDTVIFTIQAYKKNGKSYNAGLVVKKFKFPDLPPDIFPKILPWNVNTDSNLLKYANDNALRQEAQRKSFLAGHVLPEVNVQAHKMVRGSFNLNGPGNADKVFDEKDMIKAGKVSVFDYLLKHVNRLQFSYTGKKGFTLEGDKAYIIIDGNMISMFYPSFINRVEFLKKLSAREVKGIEVMYNSRYTGNYIARFLKEPPGLTLPVFIEITTRSGKILFNDTKPGAYVYRHIPFSWPKKFYSPKYPVKNDSIATMDLRSTIYWNPDVETDSTGHAALSFYAADTPTTYTVIIQGSDMKGHVGCLKRKIIVE